MKLAGTYTFEASTQIVWDALFDPEVLAATLPGCKGLVREGDEFTGDINVKMGPVQGQFKGKVNVTDQKPTDSYTMLVNGRGPAGLVKATAKIELSALAEDRTEMAYEADVSVGGRIASVGQRLLDASSRAIVKQSLEGLNQQITARAQQVHAAGMPADSLGEAIQESATATSAPRTGEAESATETTGADGAPATPPSSPLNPVPVPQVSQAAFMAGVAKEMGKDLLPPRTLIALGLIALLLVGGLLWLL